MLKKHKNGFLSVIENQGFTPEQFKKYEKEVDGNPAFILQLQNSPLFFMARTSRQSYDDLDIRYIQFAPDYPKSEYYPENGWTNIQEVYEFFGYWISKHVKPYLNEFEVPDLWEQIGGKQLFDLDPLSTRDDAVFDKVEKQRLREALGQFKNMLELEFKPTEDQLEVIVDRLEYLSGALDRLNKVDWQGLAISTIISISIALSLDTDKGKSLFEMFKTAFNAVSQLLSG